MTGKLFILDPGKNAILTMDPDGSNRSTLIPNRTRVPDGIVVDPVHGHIYWTEMGEMEGDRDTGCIMRAKLDGSNITTLVPTGITRTPKQIQIDIEQERLWWCDREGMKVMTCPFSGSPVTTLITSKPSGEKFAVATRDARNHCVGVTIDHSANLIYWTQKGPPKGGQGRIFRAGLDLPTNGKQVAAQDRNDIELVKADLPEPIDLEFCVIQGQKYLYWTDRGSPPDGNSVNRCAVSSSNTLGPIEILMTGFDETIGISIVESSGIMYFTDLGGNIYQAGLNGSGKKQIGDKLEGDIFTGIWYVEM